MYFDQRALPEFLQLGAAERKRIIDRKVAGIRTYFRDSGFEKAVIGLSGGVDSALSLALTTRALGPENVIAVRLPSTASSEASLTVAEEVASSCRLPTENMMTLNVGPIVTAARDITTLYPGREGLSDLRRGNMAARARMMVLMDVATWKNALMVGTENRTENALAYFTIGGDSVSNFEPFLDLWKVQVYMIGEAIGLPQSVLDRVPSAELWVGQTDEGEIGVSYPIIDTVLAGTYDEGMRAEQIVEECGIALEDVEKVLGHVAKMRGKRESPFELDLPDLKFLEF